MTPSNPNTHPNPVLDSVRRGLASHTQADTAAARPRRDKFGVEVSTQGKNTADLVSDFRVELEALSGHVHLPGTRSAAIDVVLGLVKEYSVDSMLSWDREQLPLAGIWEELAAAGVTMIDGPVPGSGDDRPIVLANQARAQMGLTGAQAGLADTGSLVLVSGSGRARLASLLPPVHVALLPAEDLLPSLDHLFTIQPQMIQEGSNMILVTGPSRTADIELTLTIGVHGPRHLHVILLPSPNQAPIRPG